MSATRSEDATNAISEQTGEFHSRVPPSEPLEKGGHKPGVLASEADRRPEFHAEPLPAGSAPSDRTFQPNNINEVPPQAGNPSATDTLGGATSADVHTGLGHPGQGQTSSELRHDGQHTASKQGHGLAGVGASGVGNDSKIVSGQDPAFAESQRAINREEAQIGRGNVGGPAAEERYPETSETVAAEAPRK